MLVRWQRDGGRAEEGIVYSAYWHPVFSKPVQIGGIWMELVSLTLTSLDLLTLTCLELVTLTDTRKVCFTLNATGIFPT